jgi:hypothetical protein
LIELNIASDIQSIINQCFIAKQSVDEKLLRHSLSISAIFSSFDFNKVCFNTTLLAQKSSQLDNQYLILVILFGTSESIRQETLAHGLTTVF